MVHSLLTTVCTFLKKLKIESTYDPAILLLGIFPEKTVIQEDTCTPIYTAALHNRQDIEATQISINKGMDK